jgi:hypothetical protein
MTAGAAKPCDEDCTLVRIAAGRCNGSLLLLDVLPDNIVDERSSGGRDE